MQSGDFPFCSVNEIEKHKWLQTEGFLIFYSLLYFIESKTYFFFHIPIGQK